MTTKKTFRWFPDSSHSLAINPNVDVTKLGEGYEQRQRRGITPMLDVWDLTFTGNTQEIAEIEKFLREHAGYMAFIWRNPDEVTGRYVCRSWKRGREHGVITKLSVQFEQVPEL